MSPCLLWRLAAASTGTFSPRSRVVGLLSWASCGRLPALAAARRLLVLMWRYPAPCGGPSLQPSGGAGATAPADAEFSICSVGTVLRHQTEVAAARGRVNRRQASLLRHARCAAVSGSERVTPRLQSALCVGKHRQRPRFPPCVCVCVCVCVCANAAPPRTCMGNYCDHIHSGAPLTCAAAPHGRAAATGLLVPPYIRSESRTASAQPAP